jgi:hypothetical protein
MIQRATKFRIQSGMAWMMAFALLNVISVCPVLAHQVPAAQSCCEHSPGRDLPCTETTSHNCPYLMLEKSQVKLGVPALFSAPVASTQAEEIRPETRFSSLTWRQPRADASGSCLLFRVLLI